MSGLATSPRAGRWYRFKKRALTLVTGLAVGAYVLHTVFPRGDAEEEVERLIDLLALKPGMTVAEIGAGRGEMTLHMARKLGADSRVYSTELNPEREDEIREAVEEAGLTDVTVLAAGKTETNLPPASCDAIFMSKVYHHFTEPRRINHSLYETLRPGGALTIIDFEPYSWDFWLRRPDGVPEERSGHGVRLESVVQELIQAGFEVDKQIDDWWPAPFRRFCVVVRKPSAARDSDP